MGSWSRKDQASPKKYQAKPRTRVKRTKLTIQVECKEEARRLHSCARVAHINRVVHLNAHLIERETIDFMQSRGEVLFGLVKYGSGLSGARCAQRARRQRAESGERRAARSRQRGELPARQPRPRSTAKTSSDIRDRNYRSMRRGEHHALLSFFSGVLFFGGSSQAVSEANTILKE